MTHRIEQDAAALVAAIDARLDGETARVINFGAGPDTIVVDVRHGRSVGVTDCAGWNADELGGTGAYCVETTTGEGWWERVEGTETFLPSYDDIDAVAAEVARQVKVARA